VQGGRPPEVTIAAENQNAHAELLLDKEYRQGIACPGLPPARS
jgi:hypothetical protein